jgi:hypothetical protein
VSAWRIDALILSCAISAGIHGALVPEHGASFGVAAAVAAALAVMLTVRPDDLRIRGAAVATLGAFIVAYAAAITTGLPVVHPEVEPLEGLAVFTKAVEALGIAAAMPRLGRLPRLVHAKGI